MYSQYFDFSGTAKRFYYIDGYTADSFFSDSAQMISMEWMIYQELRHSGYNRILFYDSKKGLYAYDDFTIDSMKSNSDSSVSREGINAQNPDPIVSNLSRGLKAGKWESKRKRIANPSNEPKNTPVSEKKEKSSVYKANNSYLPGKQSKVQMLVQNNNKLYLDIQGDFLVLRQIEALMGNADYKTAIVFRDVTTINRRAVASIQYADDFSSLLNAITQYPPTNKNIMVFINQDAKFFNEITEEEYNQNTFKLLENADYVNKIFIGNSNAIEIKNMLNYFRYHRGLIIKYSELSKLAEAICSNTKMIASKNEELIRNNDLFLMIERFMEKEGKELNLENYHLIFGESKFVSPIEELNSLVGMREIKEVLGDLEDISQSGNYTISSRLNKNKKRNDIGLMHIVLTGPQGTGKTTVARIIGRVLHEKGYLESGHIIETDRGGLVGEFVGQTAVKTHNIVREALGGVLFVDEAYELYRKGSREDFGNEAITTLVKDMDLYKNEFVVIFAGYPDRIDDLLKNANQGLEGRFKYHFHIDDYGAEEIGEILQNKLSEDNYIFSDDLFGKMGIFYENWVNSAGAGWANGREAEKLSKILINNFRTDKNSQIYEKGGKKYKIIEEKHIPEEMRGFFKSPDELKEDALAQIDSFIGLSGVKNEINNIRLSIINGDIKEAKNYIFTGNPGTGKTMIAGQFGKLLKNLGLLKWGQVVSHTVNELHTLRYDISDGKNKTLEDIVDEARNGVFFVDEAYELKDHPSLVAEFLPVLLNRTDICFIFAGYKDDMVELQEVNPGLFSRVDKWIEFEDYSAEELLEIMKQKFNQDGYLTDEGFYENALIAIKGYMREHSRDKNFGNARFIEKTFIPGVIETKNNRLEQRYGKNTPNDEKKKILSDDMPSDMVKYIENAKKQEDVLAKLDNMIGFKEVKDAIRKSIKRIERSKENNDPGLLKNQSFHWVLTGNPGTGKTTVAKMIADVYREYGVLERGHFVKVTRNDLVSIYSNGTSEQTTKKINEALGGILFIDEAYMLSPGEKSNVDSGKEAIDTLLEAMSAHNGEFGVIVAGYPNEMKTFLESNPGLKSRFGGNIFNLEDYTPKELKSIFEKKCQDESIEVDNDLDDVLLTVLDRMKREHFDEWANGREVENMIRDIDNESLDDLEYRTDDKGVKHRVFCLRHLPKKYMKYYQNDVMQKKTLDKINELIGFDSVKAKLRTAIHRIEVARDNSDPSLLEDQSFHWILKGNPGTGKTTVVSLVGELYKEYGVLDKGHVVKVTRDQLVAGYEGQTAIKTKEKIEEAMGGILFIDEAYTLSAEKGSGVDFGQEAINTILEAMSDHNGEFGVVAAGYPKEMEHFLETNPGFRSRFGNNIFELDDYSAAELKKIFDKKCEKLGYEVREDLDEVIEKLFENMIHAKIKGWANGREVENLLRSIGEEWINNVLYNGKEGDERKKVITLEHLPEKYKAYLITKEDDNKNEDFSIGSVNIYTSWERFDIKDNNCIEEIKQSIVLIDYNNGQGYGTGSVITSDGYILTCNHVVKDADSLRVKITIPGRAAGDVSWHDVEVVYQNDVLDFAIVKANLFQYPALPIRNELEDLPDGTDLFMIGYPFGSLMNDNVDDLKASMFKGSISSIQRRGGRDMMNTNMEGKSGCSGAPVFSLEDGRIVGLFCGSTTKAREGLVEELNYALPVRYIWENIIK